MGDAPLPPMLPCSCVPMLLPVFPCSRAPGIDFCAVHTTLDLWSMLFVFMLATFVGFQVIQNVSRLLHTPLMSLTNAISSIAVVGAIIIAGEAHDTLSTVLGALAVFASTTNLVSGYLITDRMLRMFKKREAPKS